MQYATDSKYALRVVDPLQARHRDIDLVEVFDFRQITEAALVVVSHEQESIDAARHCDRIRSNGSLQKYLLPPERLPSRRNSHAAALLNLTGRLPEKRHPRVTIRHFRGVDVTAVR